MSLDRKAQDALRAYIERVERVHEERKALADDIRDIFKEAKGHGFNVAAMKGVIAYRAKDPDKAKEDRAIFELYLEAVQSGTNPAIARAPARPAEAAA